MDILWPIKPSRFRKIFYSFLVAVIVLYLFNFRISFDPLVPPGCIQRSTNYFGGCFSKQKITFQLSYSMRRCLQISTNNCSKPAIQLFNGCGKEMTVVNTEYSADDRYVYLDQKDNPGFVYHRGNIGGLPFFVISFVSNPECR